MSSVIIINTSDSASLYYVFCFTHISCRQRPFAEEAWTQIQRSKCGICGGHSGTGTGLFSSTSVSPVSVIPPVLHAYILFVYHRRYITLGIDNSLNKRLSCPVFYECYFGHCQVGVLYCVQIFYITISCKLIKHVSIPNRIIIRHFKP